MKVNVRVCMENRAAKHSVSGCVWRIEQLNIVCMENRAVNIVCMENRAAKHSV